MIGGAFRIGLGAGFDGLAGQCSMSREGVLAWSAIMSSESAAGTAPRPRVVLVGDPDWDTRAILARALEHTGYEVRQADDGDAVLDVAAERGADLVIAEMYMRCRAGRCTVQALKRDPLLRHIPVLVYSSRVLPLDEEWAREAGADRYLRKPAPLDVVLAVVAELTPPPRGDGPRRSSPSPGSGPRQREGEDAPRA